MKRVAGYQTEDGEIFPTKAEAKRHEALRLHLPELTPVPADPSNEELLEWITSNANDLRGILQAL